MKHLFIAGAAALALLTTAGTAGARDLPSGGVTRQDVANWLQQHGLKAQIHNDDNGESIVSSGTSGVNFDVYFYACESGRCGSIQFAAGWTPLAKATQDNVNSWNRDKRYVRAYLDKHNNLWGEYDIDVNPGGTWEQMDQGLTRWDSAVSEFKNYFGG
jgi:hypothetical protein